MCGRVVMDNLMVDIMGVKERHIRYCNLVSFCLLFFKIFVCLC